MPPSRSSTCSCCCCRASASRTTRIANNGVIGRNFTHQTISDVASFFDKTKFIFNPFIASGAIGMCIDEFNGDNFDHGPHGFVGGGYMGQVQTNGRPIETTPVPPGTPNWGAKWKQAVRDNYLSAIKPGTGVHGSMYSYRDVYLDLDPTYRDRFRRPLVRITMDFHENELKQNAFLTDKFAEIFQRHGRAAGGQGVPQGALRHHRISDHAPVRRGHHGERPEDQRAQPLPAELGRAESVRHGCERFPAERRLQPDRHGGGPRLLVGGGDPLALSQESGAARACVRACSTPASCGLALLASGSRGARVARLTIRRSGQDFARIERGRYLTAAATARPATLTQWRQGRSPAADPSKRRSAMYWPPISRLIATPASAAGAMRSSMQRCGRARPRTASRLYPAMPYLYYTRMTQADVLAIRAYLNTLPAVHQRCESDQLPFPFGIRAGMRLWDALYFKPGAFSPIRRSHRSGIAALTSSGAGTLRGLPHAQELAWAGTGTRNASRAMQSRAGSPPTSPTVPHLVWGAGRPPTSSTYLKSGHNRFAAAAGPMGEEVSNSSSQMSEGDLEAIAEFLKNGPAEASVRVAPVGPSNPAMRAGAAIYQDLCSACHREDGTGVSYLIPNLAASSSVTSREPISVLRVLIHGAQSVATEREPTGPSMPAFGWQLTDAQIAAVATYIRNSWGHAAPPTDRIRPTKSAKASSQRRNNLPAIDGTRITRAGGALPLCVARLARRRHRNDPRSARSAAREIAPHEEEPSQIDR